MTRIEIVTVRLDRDRAGIVIGEQGKPEVLGRVRPGIDGGYNMMLFPTRLGNCPAPAGWLVTYDPTGDCYLRHTTQTKVEAVEECLYQVITALHAAGCMVRILGFPSHRGDRRIDMVHPGEAREKASMAAKGAARG